MSSKHRNLNVKTKNEKEWKGQKRAETEPILSGSNVFNGHSCQSIRKNSYKLNSFATLKRLLSV